MENLAQKVEEALNEVNKLHVTTLEHAAEISPFVYGRTIGADPECRTEAFHDKNLTKSNKNDINKLKSPRKVDQSAHVNQQGYHNVQNMDFQTIHSSVLIRKAEENRKRSMRQHVVEMQGRQLELMQESLKPIEQQNQEERRKRLENKERCDSIILQKAEQQSAIDLREHDRQLDALRLQTQRQLQLMSFQGISQYQSKFRNKYELIVSLLMSIDKAALMSCAEYNHRLKELIQMFEQLIGKIKSGECGPTEMKTAENLCKSLGDLEVSILDALKIEKEKREQMAIKEQQRKEREAAASTAAEDTTRLGAEKPTVENSQAPQTIISEPLKPHDMSATDAQNTSVSVSNRNPIATDGLISSVSSQFVSAERLEFYTKIITFYQEKVERVKVLQSDETMKKYRFDCQKSINIPVNAISAVSQQHIQDKFDKLYTFVTSQPALGRDYCILLMAKKFVGQGEATISSNPQAAFPVASVIVSLWKRIPEFGQLFLAYCFKESPFLVPYFIPQKRGQSVEEYSKVLGYRIVDGQLEKQDMYLKRHAGIARLYSAVMVTNGRHQDGPSHPYGLEHTWRWLANTVALSPLPDMSATLIMEILQIAGSDLWSTYGLQFVKMLHYIQQHYFPKLSAVDVAGPKARLELLLGKFLREGQIQKPSGMLPPGFW